jgi:hypothetical protein
MPAGRYFRQSVTLAWIQGDAVPTPPSSVWVHLCTSAPAAATLGAAPTIGGYDPIEIEPADWAAIVNGANRDTLSPTAALVFGPFDNSGDETATSFMVTLNEVPDTDELIAYGALGASRLMTDGGTVELGAGDLDLLA